MNKKIIALSIICILCAGCGATAKKVDNSVEHTYYFTSGRYYITSNLQGEVITEDGNAWSYTQDTISEKASYHNEPVYVGFDDMGTPDNIYDDEIVGLVLDRETAIYDELEVQLSQSFEVEREGNNIRLGTLNIVE